MLAFFNSKLEESNSYYTEEEEKRIMNKQIFYDKVNPKKNVKKILGKNLSRKIVKLKSKWS